jgi:hypothetical protein
MLLELRKLNAVSTIQVFMRAYNIRLKHLCLICRVSWTDTTRSMESKETLLLLLIQVRTCIIDTIFVDQCLPVSRITRS